MAKLHRTVPSPKALIALEAAARHGNFTAAAKELNVSQVAVTYQIKKLEEDIGAPLFDRLQRGVQLTPAGNRLSEAVRFGLTHIADVVSDIQRINASESLTIAANNAVAFYWLRPIAMAFQRAYPDVELRILASDRNEFQVEDGVAVAIRYGAGDWSDVDAQHLFDEVARPVCSPEYAARHGPFREPTDFLGATLLQLEPLEPNWITWLKWFRFQGVDFDERALIKVIGFNSYPILLEAAMAGEGIALGGLYIIDALLREGKLLSLCGEEWRRDYAYFVVTPRGKPISENARHLIAMLHKAAVPNGTQAEN